MRVFHLDYPGHAFPVQLSRALAARGHDVLHVYSTGFQAPKGPLAVRAGDPPGLAMRGLTLDAPFAKYSYIRRLAQERRIGRMVADELARYRPSVVLSANAPLDVQAASFAAARRLGVGFVFWMQDIYSEAIGRILRARAPGLGHLVGWRYRALERRLVRLADHTVVITDDFLPVLQRWGVALANVSVIENWAAREELPPTPRDNRWAAEHGLIGKTVFLYSGTLGLKHDPGRLLELARHFAHRPDIRVVVVSEGPGADWLTARAHAIGGLLVLPFQPYDRLAEVLASGDVLLAVLEPDAGVFSVPSKVLTYLCAGRPILAAIPPENLAGRIIARNRAGLVVPPGDTAALLAAGERLVGDPALRAELSNNALDYARRTFDIDAVAARFESILRAAEARGHAHRH
ncbi:MAG TPA: glycosyltransferase family 4 protein [Alphaproteobacteria bacterium]|jgi:glycosyltransferase involved in cell wall biosynthesis|nr:glycosyltransferase family 4 protein [Alphaproteobacteria bacterium]